MTCGLCGSGITAEEKFKQLKNGEANRYVYYKCTRVRDPFCKNDRINEDDLVVLLQDLVNDLDMKMVPMRERVTEELKRFKEFEQMLLGNKNTTTVKDIDIRAYAKFVLQEGSVEEKREFIRCLKSQIVLTDRKVSLR